MDLTSFSRSLSRLSLLKSDLSNHLVGMLALSDSIRYLLLQLQV